MSDWTNPPGLPGIKVYALGACFVCGATYADLHSLEDDPLIAEEVEGIAYNLSVGHWMDTRLIIHRACIRALVAKLAPPSAHPVYRPEEPA